MWPKMKHFQNMVTPPHSEVIENEKRTCPHRMLVNMFKETKLTQRLLILSKGFVENIFWVSWIRLCATLQKLFRRVFVMNLR